ncbi:MAG: hypothetical protein RLZZ337_1266 [Bacteroidota bacterium]|jgi:hypothetical protein
MGEINIDLGISYSSVGLIVRNQLSQEVLKTSFSDSNLLQFNIPGEAGVYYIEVMSDQRKAVVRVVKK